MSERVSCGQIEGKCCDACHDEFDMGYDSGEVGEFVNGKYQVQGYSCCLKLDAVRDEIGSRLGSQKP